MKTYILGIGLIISFNLLGQINGGIDYHLSIGYTIEGSESGILNSALYSDLARFRQKFSFYPSLRLGMEKDFDDRISYRFEFIPEYRYRIMGGSAIVKGREIDEPKYQVILMGAGIGAIYRLTRKFNIGVGGLYKRRVARFMYKTSYSEPYLSSLFRDIIVTEFTIEVLPDYKEKHAISFVLSHDLLRQKRFINEEGFLSTYCTINFKYKL